MSKYAIFMPKPECNEETVLPASTLRVYESSRIRNDMTPLATLTMIEPDGTLAAALRLDRDQVHDLVNKLLTIIDATDLNTERAEAYADGFGDGFASGYDAGYAATRETA